MPDFITNLLSELSKPVRQPLEQASMLGTLLAGNQEQRANYRPIFTSQQEAQQAYSNPLLTGSKNLAQVGSYAIPGGGGLASAIGKGTLAGGLMGYGTSGTGNELQNTLTGGLTGGAVGGAANVVGGLLGKLGGKLGKTAQEAATKQKTYSTLEPQPGFIPKGMTAATMKKNISTVGNLLDSTGGYGSDIVPVSDNIGKLLNTTGSQMEQSLATNSTPIPIKKLVDMIKSAPGANDVVVAKARRQLIDDLGNAAQNISPTSGMKDIIGETRVIDPVVLSKKLTSLNEAIPYTGSTTPKADQFIKNITKTIKDDLASTNPEYGALKKQYSELITYKDKILPSASSKALGGTGDIGGMMMAAPKTAANVVGLQPEVGRMQNALQDTLKNNKVGGGLASILGNGATGLSSAIQSPVARVATMNQLTQPQPTSSVTSPEVTTPTTGTQTMTYNDAMGVNQLRGTMAQALMTGNSKLSSTEALNQADMYLQSKGIDTVSADTLIKQSATTGSKLNTTQQKYSDVVTNAQQALDLINQNPGVAGKIGSATNAVGSFLGGGDTNTQQYQSSLALATTSLMNALLGTAQTESEKKSLMNALPQPTDEANLAKTKLQALINAYSKKIGTQ